MCLGIQRNDFVRRFAGKELIYAVGYFVEAVTGAQHFELVLRLDELPHLLDGSGEIQILGAVF